MNASGKTRSRYSHLLQQPSRKRAAGSSLPGPLKVKQEEKQLVACFHEAFQQLEDVRVGWQVKEMERRKEAVPGGCYLAGKIT